MRFHSAVGLIAVLLLLASTLPGVALASKARVEALGIQPDYVVDRVNVQTYPSALFRHQNIVYAELGVMDQGSDFNDNNQQPALDESDRSVGAYFGNWWEGRIGVFGIEINETATPLTPALGGGYWNRNENESINLMWANQWGGTTFGLGINRTFSQITDKWGGDDDIIQPYTGPNPWPGLPLVPNSREEFNFLTGFLGADHWNSMGLDVGLSFDWESNGYDNTVDLSGEIRQYSYKFQNMTGAGNLVSEGDASPSFAFNGRAMLQTGDNMTWVPVINFARTDWGWKADSLGVTTTGGSASNTVTNINVGIAGEWQLRESDLVVAGIAFQSVAVDFQDINRLDFNMDDPLKYTYTQLPNLFVSYEGNIWNWLTFRAGGSKPVYARISEENPAGEKFQITDSPFQFALGAGLHLGNFTFDTVVNQDWTFTAGPLSSDDGGHNPFVRVSADYRF
jgi:hypothetical protein